MCGFDGPIRGRRVRRNGVAAGSLLTSSCGARAIPRVRLDEHDRELDGLAVGRAVVVGEGLVQELLQVLVPLGVVLGDLEGDRGRPVRLPDLGLDGARDVLAEQLVVGDDGRVLGEVVRQDVHLDDGVERDGGGGGGAGHVVSLGVGATKQVCLEYVANYSTKDLKCQWF